MKSLIYRKKNICISMKYYKKYGTSAGILCTGFIIKIKLTDSSIFIFNMALTGAFINDILFRSHLRNV